MGGGRWGGRRRVGGQSGCEIRIEILGGGVGGGGGGGGGWGRVDVNEELKFL